MSGLGPLVDTLLATRLAQRVDLVPLKPEAQLAGPGPVTQVDEVVNDVRLPSRAAVEQQIGVGLRPFDPRSQGAAAMPPDQAVRLSAAGHTVSAILQSPTSIPPRIVGSAPLLALAPLSPSAPIPAVAEIALALARAVGSSGLFYESHLAQFAAGTRSLAELAQEPQARFYSTAGSALAWPALPQAPGPDAAPPAPGPAGSETQKNASAALQEPDGSTSAAGRQEDTGANAPRASAPAPAGIHQDGLDLVRQQLELLAQPAFRWGGEAWPGTPLDWEVRKDEGGPATGDAAVQPGWSTRLALALPLLRDIEVRISLAGNSLQVRLAASEETTVELLQDTRARLSARLEGLGLQLAGLQIGPGPASTPKAGDGA